MNEHHKVMTEHLAKRFVDHRGIGLAPDLITEFPFEHGERRLETGVDLEGCGKDGISKRYRWPATALYSGFPNASAEIAQQLLKLVLFARLSGIVGSPFLRIGFLLGEKEILAAQKIQGVAQKVWL